jgi:hypothetical protein
VTPRPVRHNFRRHKYGVSPKEERTCDGITFDSKKEMCRYQYLKLEQAAGNILFFLRQTTFHLVGAASYHADFVVFWANGNVTVEDVKGTRTSQYLAKKRKVEKQYPVKIVEL